MDKAVELVGRDRLGVERLVDGRAAADLQVRLRLRVALRGVKTDGPMAPELDLTKQRPADYVFDNNVQKFVTETAHTPKGEKVGAA